MSTDFRKGYEAFKRGEPISNSPRVADLTVGEEWRKGWLHAKAGKPLDRG